MDVRKISGRTAHGPRTIRLYFLSHQINVILVGPITSQSTKLRSFPHRYLAQHTTCNALPSPIRRKPNYCLYTVGCIGCGQPYTNVKQYWL